MKKIQNNNKKNKVLGFTLIELLSVIIILSLLVILVMPNITNSVRNYSSKTDALTLSMLENAAKLYIDDNSADFIEKEGNQYCIKVSDLTINGYLKDSIEYNGEDITNTKSLKLIYNNGFDFEIIDNDDCVICRGVSETTKTSGNVPVGNFNAGDEYTCEVKEGTEYNFLVLNKEGDNVHLIMNKNIGNVVAWSTSEITLGPLDVLSELELNTSDWTNINLYDYELSDDSGNNFSIIRPNVRARLLTYSEATELGCAARTSEDMETAETCESWLYSNFEKPPFAYWLSSSVSGSTEYAWYLTYLGDLRYTNVIGGDNGTNITTNGSYGARPVISIPVYKIDN